MPLQAEAASRRQNNFNLLRMLAALAVLVSHAYSLSLGRGAHEPLENVLGMNLGVLAVLTFFAISGYFISKSFADKRSLSDFVVARVLRLYPGLTVMLLLTIFVLGPAFTRLTIDGYFSNRETWSYFPKNLMLWPGQDYLPGVFEDNPFATAINGSLWSLPYEAACYVMVAVVATFRRANDRRVFIAFLIGFAIFYLAGIALLNGRAHPPTLLRNAHLVTLPFVLGMALFEFRDFAPLRLSALAALGAASVLSHGHPWFPGLFVLTWSYGVIYLGFVQSRHLSAYNALGDYSYGVYIYGFPVQQIVASLCAGCSPSLMMLWSLPPTILLAMLSWHLIERRALAQRSRVAAYFSGKTDIGPTPSTARVVRPAHVQADFSRRP